MNIFPKMLRSKKKFFKNVEPTRENPIQNKAMPKSYGSPPKFDVGSNIRIPKMFVKRHLGHQRLRRKQGLGMVHDTSRKAFHVPSDV